MLHIAQYISDIKLRDSILMANLTAKFY